VSTVVPSKERSSGVFCAVDVRKVGAKVMSARHHR